MKRISSSELSLLRDLINETLDNAFLYEAAPIRSRIEILAITGPINDRIEALTKQKCDRMYELLKADDLETAHGRVGDSYERLWSKEKADFDLEIQRLEDLLIPLDKEYWKSR